MLPQSSLMLVPFGLVVRDDDFRAQLAQNARGRFVGRAIRDIDGDPHFFERHSRGKLALANST